MRPAPTLWTWTARSMAVGAAWDALFAVAILLFAEPAGRLLGIPPPDDRLYFRLVGVLLGILAGVYVLAARDPRRLQGIVAVAACGRLAGFVVMAWAWSRGAPPAFLALAYADLALAAAHAWLLVSAQEAEAVEALPKARRR